MLREVFDI